jgi:hypothetical protein
VKTLEAPCDRKLFNSLFWPVSNEAPRWFQWAAGSSGLKALARRSAKTAPWLMQQRRLWWRWAFESVSYFLPGSVGLITNPLGTADASVFPDLEGDARFGHTNLLSQRALKRMVPLTGGINFSVPFLYRPASKWKVVSGGPDPLVLKPKERGANHS